MRGALAGVKSGSVPAMGRCRHRSRPPIRSWSPRALRHLPRADACAVRARGSGRHGGGEAVIGFEIFAATLAVGTIVYLLIALLNPERF